MKNTHRARVRVAATATARTVVRVTVTATVRTVQEGNQQQGLCETDSDSNSKDHVRGRVRATVGTV